MSQLGLFRLKMRAMKRTATLLVLCCSLWGIKSQTSPKVLQGKVSYVSSQNIYVRFDNTDGIRIGDTLFVEKGGVLTPTMTVTNKSSISCVGSSIGGISIAVATPIVAKQGIRLQTAELLENEAKTSTALAVNDEVIQNQLKVKNEVNRQHISGRISLSSYGEKSKDYLSNQRYRYNINLNAEHIKNSKLSAEMNMTYTSTYVPQHTVKLPPKIITDPVGTKPDSAVYIDSIASGKWKNSNFYIYSLAVTYNLSKSSSVSFGRKLNINLANIGAVDGVQITKRFKHISVGAIAGTRPDYYDYSFNPKLLQYGVFIGHDKYGEKMSTQTSVAFFNQTNNGNTDRRFAYLQHHTYFNNRFDLFASLETDFYTLENNQPTSTFDLTSTYVSLSYQPWKRLSLSLSYDARKNVYYYESFRNRADSIYDKETRQGLRLNFSYRPFRYLYWGGNVGYRMKQKMDYDPAINAYTFLNYTNTPLINASMNINATLLKTNNLDGSIYGATLSRDFFSSKLFAEVGYRMVDYQFKRLDSTLHQDIYSLSLSYVFSQKMILSGDYEYTKEDTANDIHSLFMNLTYRF